MTKGEILRQSKTLDPKDRLAFNRWLKGNVIVGLIVVTGLMAMILLGPKLGTYEPTLATGKNPPDVVARATK